MLRDARDIAEGAMIETEVCLVGGGAAGLTVARQLSAAGLDVVLLESGGADPTPAGQALAKGEITGEELQPLDETRVRALGGTAHLWNSGLGTPWHPNRPLGLRAGPLAPIDFEEREGVPHSGWPFDRNHLEPFYKLAQRLCGLGPFAYEGETWAADHAPLLPFDPSVVETSVWQFAPREVVTRDLRGEVTRAPTVTVYLNATVVELERARSARSISALRVATPNGTRFRVTARAYVLAAGGIENARLLLLSQSTYATAPGNEHDLVGRYFAEHQMIRGGALTPSDPELFERMALYDVRTVEDVLVAGKLEFTEELLRRERLLNISFALLPSFRGASRARQQPVESLSALIHGAARLRLPEQAAMHLREVLTHLDYLAIAGVRKLSKERLFPYFRPAPDLVGNEGWMRLPEKSKRFSFFDVLVHAEQAPDPDNRVTLGTRRDAFGNRVPRLHWRWRPIDITSVQRALELFAHAVEDAGIGTFRAAGRGGRPPLLHAGLHHHMGTTRMHRDPRHGVVDENGRVHTVENLFITGHSVFPTGGYINPTLTVVALALRLADHLARELGAPAEEAAARSGAGGEMSRARDGGAWPEP